MTDEDEERPYRVRERDRGHDVVDRDGEVILGCGDSRSAHHYASLLNEAFRRGRREGYRAGKNARRSPTP